MYNIRYCQNGLEIFVYKLVISCNNGILTKKIYDIQLKYIRQLYGGVPERLIGAVLKTVVRSRVPWVRIPPPPNKDGLTFVRPVFIFYLLKYFLQILNLIAFMLI